ncbi:MAG: hypothetical protein ACI9Y1_003143, partial [Lentisphaeria bacterium]
MPRQRAMALARVTERSPIKHCFVINADPWQTADGRRLPVPNTFNNCLPYFTMCVTILPSFFHNAIFPLRLFVALIFPQQFA